MKGTLLSARPVLTTVGTRVLLITLSLVTGVLTARLLGPEGRGQYFLGATLMTLSAQFATLGLHSSNTFLLCRRPEALPQLLANSLWFSLLAGAVSALCFGLLVAGGLVPVIDGRLATVALVGVVPSLFTLLGSGLLAGLRRFSALNRCELLSRSLPLVFVLALAAWPSPMVFLGAVVAGSLIGGLSQIRVLLRLGGLGGVDRGLFSDAFRYGLRLYIASALAYFVARASVFVLGYQGGAAEVGLLSIATQLADVMTVVPASLAMVLFPELVGSQRRWETTQRALRGTAAFMLALCVAAAVLAPALVPAVFGRAFEGSAGVFLWFLPGVFFLGLISILSQYVAAVGYPWSMVGAWAAAAALVVITSVVLIPRQGAAGAGAALSATYACLFAVIVALALRERRAERLAPGAAVSPSVV